MEILKQDIKNIESKKRFEFYIKSKLGKDIIGVIIIDNIIYGSFLSCYLGYKLDEKYLSKGFMTEGILSVVEFSFKDLLLHRIEENVMPRNKSPLRVLEKLGFELERLSKKYFKIKAV